MSTSSSQEVALARALLEITNEAELDRLMSAAVKSSLAGLKPVAAAIAKAARPVMRKAAARALPGIKRRPVPRLPGDNFGFGSAVGTRDARLWGTSFQRSRPREIQLAMSLRFMQAARRASRQAAIAALRQMRRGGPVTYAALRRVIYRALLRAIRERAPFLLPTMSAVSSALRQAPAATGSILPLPRPGKILAATAPPGRRQRPGYTGPTLPTPRSRVLG